MPAFIGRREAARGPMQKAHAQVTLELGNCVACRLRRDALSERGLADAAELYRLGKCLDGAKLVERHGRIIKANLLLVQSFTGYSVDGRRPKVAFTDQPMLSKELHPMKEGTHMSFSRPRRGMLQAALALGAATLIGVPAAGAQSPSIGDGDMSTSAKWDKVFPQSAAVAHQKVTFKNRFGITLTADLYRPKTRGTSKLPALVVSGPFGAVKEQSSGLYAQTLAERGFVTLAFDPTFTGESGGGVRNVGSPEIFTEDFSAAIDYIGLLPEVDRNRIGVIGICGLSGMALTAATADSRIKAVATASMYDMSRSMSRSHKDRYTREQRQKVIDYLSQQRWADAEKGSYALGFHEVPFDNNGQILKGNRVLPENLPVDSDPVLAAFYDYYRTPRGFHPRAINSTTAWTATTPMSFFAFPMAANIEMIAPRPIMLVAGANAHSRYYSEDVYKAAPGPKELVIVPDADHVDLYDQLKKIPFEKLEVFFKRNLK